MQLRDSDLEWRVTQPKLPHHLKCPQTGATVACSSGKKNSKEQCPTVTAVTGVWGAEGNKPKWSLDSAPHLPREDWHVPQHHVKTQEKVTPPNQLLSPPGSLPLALTLGFVEVDPCGCINALSAKSCRSHSSVGRVEGRNVKRSGSSALLAAVKRATFSRQGELTPRASNRGNGCSCSGSANRASGLQPWHWSRFSQLLRDVEARKFGSVSWLLGITTHCYSNRGSHDYCL